METPITHIIKVEIEKLWGLDDWNLSWELNPDVNILAGDNGSGKSTVLDLIAGILLGNLVIEDNQRIASLLKSSTITFNNGKKIDFYRFIDTLKNLKKQAKTDKSIQRFIEIEGENLKNNQIIEYQRIWTEEIAIEPQNLKNIINISIISTFDSPLLPLEILEKYNTGKKVITELDKQLSDLNVLYLNYQVNIGKRALKAVKDNSNIENYNKFDDKINLFWNIVDDLFAKTKKSIERDNNSLSFLLGKDINLTPYELSAGEKQILIILLTTLVQDNQPAIMIMDEPEVSLHTDWQKDLIDNIRKLNENVQLIIATHSPAMIMKGWASPKYVFQIEDLKTNLHHEPIGANQQ